MPFIADLPVDWPQWLEEVDVPVGTPFLLSPALGYDVALNAFFRCPSMLGTAWNTHAGYARDLRPSAGDPRTWNREVAAVNRFYRVAGPGGHVPANPIPQREKPADKMQPAAGAGQ